MTVYLPNNFRLHLFKDYYLVSELPNAHSFNSAEWSEMNNELETIVRHLKPDYRDAAVMHALPSMIVDKLNERFDGSLWQCCIVGGDINRFATVTKPNNLPSIWAVQPSVKVFAWMIKAPTQIEVI